MNQTTQIKRQFRSSIRRGTGEANLLIRKNPKIDFSADIIKASLRNFAYDGQCEPSRAPYLFELICLSGQREKIRQAVLRGLATEHADTWSLSQLFDLGKIFAQQGDGEARKAVYDRFFNNPIEGADWMGYAEILELDGVEGLKFIAEKIGRSLVNNPDDWQDMSIIAHAQEINPQIKVIQVLEEAGQSNPFIRTYLENVQRTEDEAKPDTRKVTGEKNVVEEILSVKMHPDLSKRNLSDAELQLIAERLLVEKNNTNKEKLLAVFGEVRFPLDEQVILEFASDKARSQNRIANLALDALTFLTSESIRTFVFERIHRSNNPGPLSRVLKSNYKKGDGKLLAELVGRYKREDVIESLAISYVDVYKSNRTKECKEPLEALYNKLTCAIHREDIVKLLIENDVLSDQIKEEIEFDCEDSTRKLLG
ncbi:MAG: hypothetical protein WC810_27515 [Janthinobacterium sp.]|jgi:hypothetical protein